MAENKTFGYGLGTFACSVALGLIKAGAVVIVGREREYLVLDHNTVKRYSPNQSSDKIAIDAGKVFPNQPWELLYQPE